MDRKKVMKDLTAAERALAELRRTYRLEQLYSEPRRLRELEAKGESLKATIRDLLELLKQRELFTETGR